MPWCHGHRLFKSSTVTTLFMGTKTCPTSQSVTDDTFTHLRGSNTGAVNHLKGPQDPITKWKYTNCIFFIISEPGLSCKVFYQAPSDFSFLHEKLIWGFSPCSPQDVYGWQIRFGIPGERHGGRLVEMPHQEDADRADKKHRCHDDKADPVNHPGNQEPLFILLN